MISIPGSTRSSLTRRLNARAREHWPQIHDLAIRFRNPFAYIDADLTNGETIKLCRLHYTGCDNTWGFEIWRAFHNDYQDFWLPTGPSPGTAEDALDTACWHRFNNHTPPPTN